MVFFKCVHSLVRTKREGSKEGRSEGNGPERMERCAVKQEEISNDVSEKEGRKDSKMETK